MPRSKHLPIYALGIVAVTVVGWVGLAPAKSRTSQADSEWRCSARVKELEAEVLSLRKQLHELSERPGNAPIALGRSTRTTRIAGTQRATKDDPSASCVPPFGFDQHGIKYYRPECLEPAASDACSVPYAYTSTGIKTYKPDCLEKAASTSTACESPFSFDAQGIKSFRPECL
jgi:hypothetical protein